VSKDTRRFLRTAGKNRGTCRHMRGAPGIDHGTALASIMVRPWHCLGNVPQSGSHEAE
jgi:hypothetical protein